jgi:AraC-like DNA-binding protein
MPTINTFRMPAPAEAFGFAIRDEARATRTEQPHRHDFFQLRLDVAGGADHHIGARRRLLMAGSMSFVAPYRIHRGGRRSDSRFYVINFHHRFLRPGLGVDGWTLQAMPLQRAPELAPFAFQEFIDFRLEGEDMRRAREACDAMLEQCRRPRLCSADLVRAHLMLLLGTVCQRYERELARLAAANGGARCERAALSRVMRYVGEHLAEGIALADAAAAAGLSPGQVTRLLKKETGKTFVDFLTACRLQRAQELLVNTPRRIGEIAAAVGYPDDAYFARRFRQRLRVSPSEYRARAARSIVMK